MTVSILLFIYSNFMPDSQKVKKSVVFFQKHFILQGAWLCWSRALPWIWLAVSSPPWRRRVAPQGRVGVSADMGDRLTISIGRKNDRSGN
jgi:hypothetical protein